MDGGVDGVSDVVTGVVVVVVDVVDGGVIDSVLVIFILFLVKCFRGDFTDESGVGVVKNKESLVVVVSVKLIIGIFTPTRLEISSSDSSSDGRGKFVTMSAESSVMTVVDSRGEVDCPCRDFTGSIGVFVKMIDESGLLVVVVVVVVVVTTVFKT